IFSKIPSLVTIPRTGAFELTIIGLMRCLSIIESVSWTVVLGSTANTGLFIISLSLTLAGFLPRDITLKRMSVLLTIPTTSMLLLDTSTIRAFLSFILLIASLANLSLSRRIIFVFKISSIGEDRNDVILSGTYDKSFTIETNMFYLELIL